MSPVQPASTYARCFSRATLPQMWTQTAGMLAARAATPLSPAITDAYMYVNKTLTSSRTVATETCYWCSIEWCTLAHNGFIYPSDVYGILSTVTRLAASGPISYAYLSICRFNLEHQLRGPSKREYDIGRRRYHQYSFADRENGFWPELMIY